ncbi:MAG: hybrid sensor histidine kinase/response regulator [Campylobacterota bacterium]|nr:hybrid sensor histidine kinase/response regulator [Campylobacterota bacterium]
MLSNMTLLYVEDEEIIIEEMEDILKESVKDLYIARNGQEGLELYKKHNPDMILTDVKMPLMNGLDMAKQIKDSNSDIPIILLTAFNDMELLIKSIDIGIDKYINKPIEDIAKLFAILEEVAYKVQISKENEYHKQMLLTQNKIASLGEMIGNISHQWRQPLSFITTTLTTLQVNKECGIELSEEKTYELYNNIIESVQDLSKTLDDFRNFFNPDNDKKKEFNIGETIHGLSSILSDIFKNSTVVFHCQVEDIIFYGNENILIQALLNLFNNAKDATEDMENAIIKVGCTLIDKQIIITIEDNGVGIKKDIIDKIFEPYFTTKHQSQGTGIGLYMTNQIVTKHLKGNIAVQSEPGSTIFTIYLPYNKKEV